MDFIFAIVGEEFGLSPLRCCCALAPSCRSRGREAEDLSW